MVGCGPTVLRLHIVSGFGILHGYEGVVVGCQVKFFYIAHLKTTIVDKSVVEKYNAKQQIGLRYTTKAKTTATKQNKKKLNLC